jgi:6-phosphogluconolactonase/glucosamine-6-phosphate isomerase/deaminase
MEEKINSQIPASIIRLHSLGILMVDEEAASLLKKENSGQS